jgi:hypothetical protein
MSHRNALPSDWNIKRKRKIPLRDLSGSEGRYLIDRAFDNAESITPYHHEWTKENSDGSVETHAENGIHIELPKEYVQKFAEDTIKKNKQIFTRLANL